MYPTRAGRLYLMLAGVLIVLLFAQQQQLIKLPDTGRLSGALPDSVHGSWFACVTWVLLQFIRRWTRGGATVAVTAAVGFALAVGTELLQAVTGGDAEAGDVFSDMLGMSAALCLWSVHEHLIPRRPGVTAAGLLLIASLWPLGHALLIERYRVSIMPALVRFDSAYTKYLIGSSDTTAIVAPPADWHIGGDVMKITLGDHHDYPGVWMGQPLADWRPYSTLQVDTYVAGSAPLPITISVRLDQAPVDHVYRTFECAPGPCRITLQLTKLFNTNIARVNAVVIYSTRRYAGRTFYLGGVTLER